MTNQSHALRAGVAKSDITTDEKNALIRDRLFAKVLVLDDGEKRIVLITMDATAIGGIGDVSDEFLPRLRARLQSELGIAGQSVLVNASHTHPPGRLLCEEDEQIARTFDAVQRALQNLTPVKVGWGRGYEDRISMNRNLQMKDGSQWTIRHANPCPPDEDVSDVGPHDPQIGVLRIDRLDGRPFAVVYNFACHLLFADPHGSITADFVGVASNFLEEMLGESAMAFFIQGAGGDVVDVFFKDFNRPRDTAPLGLLLGQSTLRAWRAIETGPASINSLAETIRLPRRQDSARRIAAAQREQAELLRSLRSTTLNFKSFLPLYLKYALHPNSPAEYSYRYLQAEKIGDAHFKAMDEFNRGKIEKYLQNMAAMEKLARLEDEIATYERHQKINEESGETTVAAEVVGLKIGDGVFISAPIEILTEVSLNIKAASPYEHTYIAAFSNGYLHYGPPAADYDKGGYEVIECLLAPQWQQIYEAKATEIIQRL